MSLTPAFAPDAKSQWSELEFELQELVLDELDALAVNSPASQDEIVRRDTVFRSADASHYLFLRFVVGKAKVTLIGIYHHVVPNDTV